MKYEQFKELIISEMDGRLKFYDSENLEDWIEDLQELIDSMKE